MTFLLSRKERGEIMCYAKPLQYQCGCSGGFETVQCAYIHANKEAWCPVVFDNTAPPQVTEQWCGRGQCASRMKPPRNNSEAEPALQSYQSQTTQDGNEAQHTSRPMPIDTTIAGPSSAYNSDYGSYQGTRQTHIIPPVTNEGSASPGWKQPALPNPFTADRCMPSRSPFTITGHESRTPNQAQFPLHSSRTPETWKCCRCGGSKSRGAPGEPCFGTTRRPCSHQRCADCTPKNMGSRFFP